MAQMLKLFKLVPKKGKGEIIYFNSKDAAKRVRDRKAEEGEVVLLKRGPDHWKGEQDVA